MVGLKPIPGYRRIAYNQKKGYPGGAYRVYRCPICGDLLPAVPPTIVACGCGNVVIEQVSQVRYKHAAPELWTRRNPIRALLDCVQRKQT